MTNIYVMTIFNPSSAYDNGIANLVESVLDASLYRVFSTPEKARSYAEAAARKEREVFKEFEEETPQLPDWVGSTYTIGERTFSEWVLDDDSFGDVYHVRETPIDQD